jgi:hypothetical protein
MEVADGAGGPHSCGPSDCGLFDIAAERLSSFRLCLCKSDNLALLDRVCSGRGWLTEKGLARRIGSATDRTVVGLETGIRPRKRGKMSMPEETNELTEQRSVDVSEVSEVDNTVEHKESMMSDRNVIGGSNSECEPASITVQARDWFTNLSSEERSGATSFSDGAFLGTFLSFASPWSRTSNEAENHHSSGSDGVTCGEYCVYV